MIRVTPLSRDLAVKAYGSNWYVDSANHVLREWLGQSRPAFQLGDNFPTLDEAIVAGYGHLDRKPLPNVIRMPSQAPIIGAKRHNGNNNPLTRVTVLIFDDLINQGIRVEERLISGVDFSLPTPHLLEFVDILPSAIYTVGTPNMKIAMNYMRDGNIVISDNPMILQGSALVSWTKSMAFFHRHEAVRQADRIAGQLTRAADWRSREIAIGKSSPTTAEAA